MANPQPDKYIKISQEIFNKLCFFRISGLERQCFDFIIRKTWGFGKKEDYISLSQFVEGTGLKKPNVVRSLSKLIKHKLIIKSDNKQGYKYSIQKDYEQWIPLSKVITPVIKSDNASLSKVIPTKDNTTKDNITKDNNNTNVLLGEPLKKDTNYYLNLWSNINPSYRMFFANKTQRKSMERLIKQYGEEQIERLLDELPLINIKQYAPRITSPYQLEVKMAELLIFLRRGQNGNVNIAWEN